MKGCPRICRRASAQSQSSKASAESYCILRIVEGQSACSSRKGGIVVAALYVVVDRQRQRAKASEPDLLTWIAGAVLFNETDYCIQAEDISFALTACRSRRNLAARLAAKVFSPQQRLGSNCRGVLGKKALNGAKVKAIFNACMQHFPLQRLESASSSEKEMRNAIDEVCRKTKFPAVGGEENDFLT